MKEYEKRPGADEQIFADTKVSTGNRTAQFFPNDKYFKSTLGAVKTGEETLFRLKFTRPTNPEDVFLCVMKDGENVVRYPLAFVSVDKDEYLYETKLKITSAGLYFYHFLIITRSEELRVGADENLYALLGWGQDWQLTVYDEVYKSPEWLSGGVMYQIMPDRFFTGKERFKTKQGINYRDDWGALPEYKAVKGKILNKDMFGGNLNGITKKLAYLKGLGVTCIYLNPIFEARSNHKYDTGNYRKVDPDFGTFDDLKELIKKAAKKEMKIILDGVFSHTGDDSIYFNKYGNYDSVGAYQSKDSPYYNWYNFKNFEKKEYDCWWNIDILPNVTEENPHYDEYINGEDGVAQFWTNLGIGGWRLDVVDELPDKFLDRFVSSVKKANPQALILGEVWEDASNKVSYSKRRKYFNGRQLDSVTNYPFKEDIINFVKSGDATSLSRTIKILTNNYPQKVLNNLMNILGTHDTVRILSALGENGDVSTKDKRAAASLTDFAAAFEKLKMATVLQYTLPGVPCLYYGDEAGMEGFEDPFNRRCYPWKGRNGKVLRWYRKLGAIRTLNPVIFATGEYEELFCENGIFCFNRKSGDEKITVIVNNGDKTFSFNAPDKTDLLTDKPFNGKVKAKTCAVLTMKNEN